ncbi:Na(+)-translocating NADH-quinone reductase subunit F [Pseudotamlana agarivorans]|uniref:Na(+)-translocating NADH-quinone reductase subunit F n=1 Tax=Pseudotamlana agarivorans TaxID=481183 RepID=UPI00082F19F4|nr:Na(+)-translocating NADH-quinone reductase subunit F [Tamlana agarivorans]
MKTTKRFDAAIHKLYTAFHSNQLNPACCKQCAVGNILDKTDGWKHLSDSHGSLNLNYVGQAHQSMGRKFNGYTPLELLQIEQAFLEACGFETPLHHRHKKPSNPTDKDVLFQGLSAVITLLCNFDNIPNVMDYKRVFKSSEMAITKKIKA